MTGFKHLMLIKIFGDYFFIDPTEIYTDIFQDKNTGLWGVRIIDLNKLDRYKIATEKEIGECSYVVGFFENKEKASRFSEMLYDEIFSGAFSKSSLPLLDVNELKEVFEKDGYICMKEIVFDEEVEP